MRIPDPLERTVRLPVRIVRGQLMLLDGATLPSLKDTTVGELVVPAHAILDEKTRAELVREETVTFFPSGTTLWVRVRDESLSEKLSSLRTVKKVLGENLYFVPIVLRADLGLILRGAKKPLPAPCRCEVPALETEADSVNEACMKVSTVFEPTRRSHGGNVFLYVYVEQGTAFQPLDDLRQQTVSNPQGQRHLKA